MGNNDNRVVTHSALNSFITLNGGSPKNSNASSYAIPFGEFSQYAPMYNGTTAGVVISDYTGIGGGAYTAKQLVIEKDVTWRAADAPVVVNPTSITVTPDATLNPGNTHQLTATVYPSNATNKSVTWSSENTSIATVDQNGLVTAVAEGVVKIYATSQASPTISGYATITVVNIPSGETGVSVYIIPSEAGTVNTVSNPVQNPNSQISTIVDDSSSSIQFQITLSDGYTITDYTVDSVVTRDGTLYTSGEAAQLSLASNVLTVQNVDVENLKTVIIHVNCKQEQPAPENVTVRFEGDNVLVYIPVEESWRSLPLAWEWPFEQSVVYDIKAADGYEVTGYTDSWTGDLPESITYNDNVLYGGDGNIDITKIRSNGVIVFNTKKTEEDTVTISVDDLTVEEQSTVNSTYHITPQVNTTSVTYSSSLPDTASVDENGVVTGVHEGVCELTVTATLESGSTISGKGTITVTPYHKKEISLDGVDGETTEIFGVDGRVLSRYYNGGETTWIYNFTDMLKTFAGLNDDDEVTWDDFTVDVTTDGVSPSGNDDYDPGWTVTPSINDDGDMIFEVSVDRDERFLNAIDNLDTLVVSGWRYGVENRANIKVTCKSDDSTWTLTVKQVGRINAGVSVRTSDYRAYIVSMDTYGIYDDVYNGANISWQCDERYSWTIDGNVAESSQDTDINSSNSYGCKVTVTPTDSSYPTIIGKLHVVTGNLKSVGTSTYTS